MSTYYYLGCNRCEVCTPFVSDGMGGIGLMGGVVKEIPEFMSQHLSCADGVTDISVFSEHDIRADDYARFEPDRRAAT